MPPSWIVTQRVNSCLLILELEGVASSTSLQPLSKGVVKGRLLCKHLYSCLNKMETQTSLCGCVFTAMPLTSMNEISPLILQVQTLDRVLAS